jgi:hypothetical protein
VAIEIIGVRLARDSLWVVQFSVNGKS